MPDTPVSRFDITRPEGPRLDDYAARWIRAYRSGEDVYGEARFVDALLQRSASVLDGGCGTGRVGGALARAGHRVLGVDRSAPLLEIARSYFPEASFRQRDLLQVGPADLVDAGLPEQVDVVVLAGNIMPCLADDTERDVLRNLRRLLAPGGRLVLGFKTDREYSLAQLDSDAAAVGLLERHRFSDWHLQPWRDDSDWVVSVLAAA